MTGQSEEHLPNISVSANFFSSEGVEEGEIALERIFFLVGPKDPKILALTNFLGAHFPVAHKATQQG